MSPSAARALRDQLVERLSEELDDRAAAASVADLVGADTIDRLAQAARDEPFATTGLLSFRAPVVQMAAVGSLVVFSFGNRVVDSTEVAGPVNEALAACVQAALAARTVPVFAQWEVAAHIDVRFRPISIGPRTDAAGATEYLSTAGVVVQAVALGEQQGIGLGTVGVLGFRDHAPRCVATVRSAGFTAGLPEGVCLPARYDAASGQPWTRDRVHYVAADLFARAHSPELVWNA